jgi:hypothetical protein
MNTQGSNQSYCTHIVHTTSTHGVASTRVARLSCTCVSNITSTNVVRITSTRVERNTSTHVVHLTSASTKSSFHRMSDVYLSFYMHSLTKRLLQSTKLPHVHAFAAPWSPPAHVQAGSKEGLILILPSKPPPAHVQAGGKKILIPTYQPMHPASDCHAPCLV